MPVAPLTGGFRLPFGPCVGGGCRTGAGGIGARSVVGTYGIDPCLARVGEAIVGRKLGVN